MGKKDYERFLYKVDQLNQLVKLINSSPEKYQLIIRCETHDDVVEKYNQLVGATNGIESEDPVDDKQE